MIIMISANKVYVVFPSGKCEVICFFFFFLNISDSGPAAGQKHKDGQGREARTWHEVPGLRGGPRHLDGTRGGRSGQPEAEFQLQIPPPGWFSHEQMHGGEDFGRTGNVFRKG